MSCRADVLLRANQAAGSYWISVGSQYRKGAPAGYAVLKYKNSQAQPNPANIIQPGPFDKLKWNVSDFMSFKPNSLLLAADNKSKRRAQPYLAPNAPQKTYKVPTKVDRRVVLQSTQPLLEVNGILRWVSDGGVGASCVVCAVLYIWEELHEQPHLTKHSIHQTSMISADKTISLSLCLLYFDVHLQAFDSIAAPVSPPCSPVIDAVYENTKWAQDNALANGGSLDPSLYFTPMGGNANSWETAPKALQVSLLGMFCLTVH